LPLKKIILRVKSIKKNGLLYAVNWGIIMIEEMKRQIQHLDDTFNPSDVGDYKDLLYVIYLNWIENNGENEEVNSLINNLIKKIVDSSINDNNNCDCDNCNEDENPNMSEDYLIYRHFLGYKIPGYWRNY